MFLPRVCCSSALRIMRLTALLFMDSMSDVCAVIWLFFGKAAEADAASIGSPCSVLFTQTGHKVVESDDI